MEAMQGQPVEVRMHTTGSAEGGWKAVMDWHQPRGDAERGRLEKDLIFAMQGDEDPRLLVPKGSSTYWPHYSRYPQIGPPGCSSDQASSVSPPRFTA